MALLTNLLHSLGVWGKALFYSVQYIQNILLRSRFQFLSISFSL